MRTIRLRAAAAGVVLALGTPALALDCADGGATQAAMSECASRALDRADADLNRRYARVLACLGASSAGRRLLVDAQRAWLKFRDAECRFQGSGSEGGSAQPAVVSGCLAGVTTERSRALDRYLACEEGDLSCPTPGCGPGAGSPRP